MFRFGSVWFDIASGSIGFVAKILPKPTLHAFLVSGSGSLVVFIYFFELPVAKPVKIRRPPCGITRRVRVSVRILRILLCSCLETEGPEGRIDKRPQLMSLFPNLPVLFCSVLPACLSYLPVWSLFTCLFARLPACLVSIWLTVCSIPALTRPDCLLDHCVDAK